MTKRAYQVAIAIALLLFILPGPKASLEVIPVTASDFISTDQLSRMLVVEPASIQLIDLRTAEAFQAGGITTAQNIPAASLDQSTIEALPGHRKVIFYGERTADAIDSWQYARALREQVYVLDGGLAAWNARLALSSGVTPPPAAAPTAAPAPPVQRKMSPALRRPAPASAGQGC